MDDATAVELAAGKSGVVLKIDKAARIIHKNDFPRRRRGA